MAIGDLFQLTLNQHLTGTTIPHVTNWTFAAVDVLGNAQGLFEGFTKEGGMLELINAVQSVSIINDSIRVINLFSLTDFYEADVEGTGSNAGSDILPMNCAIGFSLKLDTRGVRPGRKSISGIPEGAAVSGLITASDYIEDINALRAAMSEDVVEPLGAVFDPVVVKRIKYTVGTGDDAHDAYRLPANAGEANYGHINSALVSLRTRSMSNRAG